MTYNQVSALMSAMNELELYAGMCESEMSKENTNWNSFDRYKRHITEARESIFNIVKEQTNAE